MAPYKVDRSGTVTHRESGTIIGFVYLDRSDGWTAFDASRRRIRRLHWNGKKYAAQVVWEASAFYERPTYYRHTD
ncbi:hypothetical protein ACJ5H2_13495 [Nocardioides sp. R1-1]|uniref:hypothetical protein n=1 Tax=Nocardioides sp. R1-1 TaxID=3383502 RepID=UPI0038D0474D